MTPSKFADGYQRFRVSSCQLGKEKGEFYTLETDRIFSSEILVFIYENSRRSYHHHSVSVSFFYLSFFISLFFLFFLSLNLLLFLFLCISFISLSSSLHTIPDFCFLIFFSCFHILFLSFFPHCFMFLLFFFLSFFQSFLFRVNKSM